MKNLLIVEFDKHYANVISSIEDSLLEIGNNKEESLGEIKHYVESFPHESDYNIAQHGNLLVYYGQIRDMYKECGFDKKIIDNIDDNFLWETYKRQVGYVARKLLKEHGLWQ